MLVEAAREAARHAHAPYSKFAVGAALLMTDGTIVTGTNFENASYGLSLCAETVALATANAQGRLADVVAVAVIGGMMGPDGLPTGADVVGPCGRCRQVMNEAAEMGGRDLPVFCSSGDGRKIKRHMLSALLPHAFGPKDLSLA
ncbi:cytidine deaminase [Nostoc sp. 3335mG]|nr:cytidine deaminase [Nostoc sp. 3335mG]